MPNIKIASACLDRHGKYIPTPCIADGSFRAWRLRRRKLVPPKRRVTTASRFGVRYNTEGQKLCKRLDCDAVRSPSQSYCREHWRERWANWYHAHSDEINARRKRRDS